MFKIQHFIFRQSSLDTERSMRETAEKELANLSTNGHHRGHSTPTSPIKTRQNNNNKHLSVNHRSQNTPSPSRLDDVGRGGGARSTTPNLHLGNMETMIEELKSARLLNRTVRLVLFCYYYYLKILARLSQSLWTTTPKNFYHPNQMSIRCVV